MQSYALYATIITCKYSNTSYNPMHCMQNMTCCDVTAGLERIRFGAPTLRIPSWIPRPSCLASAYPLTVHSSNQMNQANTLHSSLASASRMRRTVNFCLASWYPRNPWPRSKGISLWILRTLCLQARTSPSRRHTLQNSYTRRTPHPLWYGADTSACRSHRSRCKVWLRCNYYMKTRITIYLYHS